MEEIILQLIMHSGDARSCAMEAIQSAKSGDYEKAKCLLEESADKLILAHNAQTTLIQAEANGNKAEFSLLLIHAQDHLMSTITVKDLAEEFVELYKRIR